MQSHTVNKLFFDRTELTQSVQQEGIVNHGNLGYGVMPSATMNSCRRREPRVENPCWCSYEMFDAIDEASAVVEQGEALLLNRSPEGLRLLMRHPPYEGQLIEVGMPYFSYSKWLRIVYVCETQWIRPVAVETQGTLYLAGCRRVFSL